MKFILAIDQGTTSSRAILFNHDGYPVAASQREFTQIFPRSGWVEHDPNEIWQTQSAVLHDVVQSSGIVVRDIAAIGITNQRETVVVWDRQTGKPICNAIVWQDRRTAEICDELRAKKLDRKIQKKTGLVVDSYFSATKLQWILDHVKHARKRAEAGDLAFGTVDSWLVWNLTGGKLHITDATNASRTMLYSLRNGDWDSELLKIFRIPRALLPEIHDSSEVYGETDILGEPLPIAGIAGDQQAALFGQMCRKPGMVKNTYGTGCFMLMNTGAEPVVSKCKLLTTVASRIGDRTEFALEGSIFNAGAAVQWLRDGLNLIESSADIEALARQATELDSLFMVPAFTGLGSPHWDPYARGLLIGLTRGTTKADVARATLAGIAFQVADILTAMQQDAGIRLKELRVDGGASTNALLMQMQADLLGVPVVRSKVTETTALGAAYLAGLAVGFWRNQNEIADQWQEDARFKPLMRPTQRAKLSAQWHRAVQRAMGWEIA